MYSVVTIVNDIMCLRVAKRVDLKSSSVQSLSCVRLFATP